MRADARNQMRFILEGAEPEADLELVARAYVKQMIWRGEIRWHPDLLTQQRVEGLEHLIAARDVGRGVILNYMHHGYYEGFSPSLARLGVQSHMVGKAHILGDDAPGWLQQNIRVSTTGGNTTVSVAVGTQGITDLLSKGLVVTLASDVPGQTAVQFVGRDVLGSFGAARIAAASGSPVIVATSELDEQRRPYMRIHNMLRAEEFDSPRALLAEMLARHQSAVLSWPEAAEIPLSRWGAAHRTAPTTTTGDAQ